MNNFFSQQNKLLEKILAAAVKGGIFSGVAVAIFQGAGKSRQKKFLWAGTTGYQSREPVNEDLFFDLASLTKPLATLPALLVLMAEGKINLAMKLADLLGCPVPADKKKISLRDLLSHAGGFPAYLPFYQQLGDGRGKISRDDLLAAILATPLITAPATRSRYSDLGFMLAGFIVENQSGRKLDHFFRDKILNPLGLADQLFFISGQPGEKRKFAASEFCHWRQRVIQGEVSDENCAAMGGVAGHAGLFGNLSGVGRMTEFLADLWWGADNEFAKIIPLKTAELAAIFTRRSELENSTWALGLDTPSPLNSSAGKLLDPDAVGHLGFTGTSFWLDPRRRLSVIILSNRVHPCRSNEKIKKFRPLFHDAVVRELEGK